MLRLVTALVYAAVASLGVATVAPQLRLAAQAVASRFSYAPDLTVPWLWLLIAAALAAGMADAVRRLAAGRRVGLQRYAAVLLLTGLAMLSRKYLLPPP